MISGHFDGFHNDHLKYIEKSKEYGDFFICVVSSDKQLLLKKGKVNIHEDDRCKILDIVLSGENMPHIVFVNKWDTDTTFITNAIKAIKPTILFRGFDKDENMPIEEKIACDEVGTKVMYARDNSDHNSHSSEIF